MLKSPFVYFGGKSKIMPLVWQYLGDVDNFVDPFMGSLASILSRPSTHTGRAETVNDLNKYIANFWRATSADPEAVARYCDWPVNETDLLARHIWLVNGGREALKRMEADPDWYDAKIAGWWVWGINAWIGSGWCSGDGPWGVDPETGEVGKVSDGGVRSQLPHLSGAGQGINRGNATTESLLAYFAALRERIRAVRVCCGDWSRIVTDGALSYGKTVGIFLDPPYSASVGRDMSLYSHEEDEIEIDGVTMKRDVGLSQEVREWAIKNGDNPRYRIALCGYDGEHDMPEGWTREEWTAGASYQSSKSAGRNAENRKREVIWFSRHCLRGDTQAGLFG